MSQHEFESTDTKKYTVTIFLTFVLLFVIFLGATTCHGNKTPPTEKNYTNVPVD